MIKQYGTNEKKWYAIQIKPKREVDVMAQLNALVAQKISDIEAYFPVENKKGKALPLFRGYIFVRHDSDGFHKTKFLDGVKDYVRFGYFPPAIPDDQIEMVKKIEKNYSGSKLVASYLTKGSKVKVIKGILAGREGVLVKDPVGPKKIAIEIEKLGQSLLINIPQDHIIEI